MTYTNNQKASLLLRLFLGVLFLSAALGKFQAGVAPFADGIIKGFEQTILPKVLLAPYAYALPYVELLIGITLILGIFTDVMLMVSAVTLLSLFFGMMLKGEGSVAGTNALYLLINVCALRWFEHVAPSVDVITRKKKLAGPSS